jgi:putative MATE family efflux protein
LTAEKSIARRMSIIPITLPILAENGLRFLFSFVDMFMLSGLVIGGTSYGDDAVAAVGLCGTFVFFINIMFRMINSGSGIVIGQYNGARNPAKALRAVMTSVVFSAAVGVLLSIALAGLARPIISIYRLNEIRNTFAGDYLTVYGAFCLTIGMNTGFATILRAYGYSKEPMIINVFANILNIFGNYCFIYGAFGLPQWGVPGVAASTVFAQGLAAVAMVVLIMRKKDIAFSLKKFVLVKWESLREILRIGIPYAAEHLSYNLAMMVMQFMVSTMDFGLPKALQVNLPAYTYAFLVSRFIAHITLSTGQGTQIITSFLVGAGRKEEAYRKVIRYFLVALAMAALLAVTGSFFRHTILGIFPMEAGVFALASSLVLMCIALETGRTWNLVIISGLKGAGDVRFPVQMGVFSMWLIGVGGAAFFAFVLTMGVFGVWLGIALDEWTRGVIMFLRWRSKIWQTKNIIDLPLETEPTAE